MARIAIVPIALGLLAACTETTASAARVRADAAARLPKIRSAALLSLDVKEYLVSAGGVAEFKEDWSAAAREAIGSALIAGFSTGASEVDATQVALIIVDRSGDVVWYNTRGLRGGDADLRGGGSAAGLMRAMVEDLPAHKP